MPRRRPAGQPSAPTTHIRVLVAQQADLDQIADRIERRQGRATRFDAVAALLGYALGATDDQLLEAMTAYYIQRKDSGTGQ